MGAGKKKKLQVKNLEVRTWICPLTVISLFSCQVMSDSCNHMDCSLPGSSVHGILQARILEWVAISFFRGAS